MGKYGMKMEAWRGINSVPFCSHWQMCQVCWPRFDCEAILFTLLLLLLLLLLLQLLLLLLKSPRSSSKQEEEEEEEEEGEEERHCAPLVPFQ